MTARTLQGMARVRSGQAPAWPLVSDRSVRSGLRGQARLRVYVHQALLPVLVALRFQSRLMLEGRTRTLRGAIPGSEPGQDLTAVTHAVGIGARSPKSSTSAGVKVWPEPLS